MKDQTKDEKWVKLKEPLESCENCVLQKECIRIRNYVLGCTLAKYRFRCPIEVLDEGTEE